MKSPLERAIKLELMNLGAPGGWLADYQPEVAHVAWNENGRTVLLVQERN